ncbi:NAC domain [Macleaya cordata]|uniref:NAC domain n=1 Tax=Macleaya cordata TaxID=56857 RepID=A0A200QK18_MACCD|nr:NAC domain [Macleaya cordata]
MSCGMRADGIRDADDSFPVGFKFYPTEDELLVHYLAKKTSNLPLPMNIIKEVNLYDYNPEELIEMYKANEEEKGWYFFTPRAHKYPNGSRPSRAASHDYWKATGVDKKIRKNDKILGYMKTLAYHQGKAPKGIKTNFIMHEFVLPDSESVSKKIIRKISLRPTTTTKT